MRTLYLYNLNTLQDCIRALREIEQASLEDACQIADGFTVSNFTETTTLDASTATTTQLADFVATFIDTLQRRGPNRTE